MPTHAARADSLTPPAARLLDAQVAFHLDRLRGERLDATVAGMVLDLLAASEGHPIGELIDPKAVKQVVRRALVDVPDSAAVHEILELVRDVVHAGPEQPYPIGDLVEREQVEGLVDELLRLSPMLERSMERLTASPLVGTMASRFMGRIVGEVLQANQAVADKVPGLGSLMSFGTSTAAKMMGAADKQFEGLLGETVGKGGAFAVSRLNRILLETLRDPTTREAMLQVWDLAAQESVSGLDRHTTREEVAGVAVAAHDLAVTALATEHAAALADAVVDAFLHRFGEHTPTQLLGELGIDREDLVADLTRAAEGVIGALRTSGELERVVRAQLEPFYASPEVAALLASS